MVCLDIGMTLLSPIQVINQSRTSLGYALVTLYSIFTLRKCVMNSNFLCTSRPEYLLLCYIISVMVLHLSRLSHLGSLNELLLLQ